MKLKQLLLVIVVSMVSAFAGVYLYAKIMGGRNSTVGLPTDGKMPVNYASFFDNKGNAADPTDFTKASNAAIPAVVHIKTKVPAKKITNNLPNSRNGNGDDMDDFFNQFFNFGPQMRPEQRASGSGVIISQDGYIVTNNHVISDESDGSVVQEIKVTLNEGRKTYTAKVVGRDPSTDLAVLKIDATNLPYMIYGNSDDLQVGQWVLAVGYPFTLEATVTAGIISAKGRSIGIIGSNSNDRVSPVESFIQTDAAVNPGNSGGPLINTNGQLIGINSAILAPNGTYAGYSFSIPVNIVKKVVNDIMKFGNVKRGYLGISCSSQPGENDDYLRRSGLQSGQGVYVMGAPSDGGAAKAGLKRGDIVTKVNGRSVATGLEMSGALANAQPGDQIKLDYIRGGKQYSTNVTLTGQPSKVNDFSSADYIGDKLGVDLKNIDAKRAAQLRIDGGVEVTNIKPNGPLKKTRMEKGFIITSVNGRDIKNADELQKALSAGRSSTIQLEGIYPGYNGIYTYQINLDEDNDNSNSF